MDVLTRSGGDRKYDLLGCGYVITGKYFTNTSAKAQVIDPVALKKDYNDRVDYDLIDVYKRQLLEFFGVSRFPAMG